MLAVVAVGVFTVAAFQLERPLEAVERDTLHMVRGTTPPWATVSEPATPTQVLSTSESVAAYEFSPPLYFQVLRGWTLLFGEHARAIRSFSLICAVGSIVGIFALGSSMVDARTGLAAASVLAILPLHLQSAVTARPYSLALLLAIALGWVGWRCVRGDNASARWWVAYGALLVVAGLTHYLLVAVPIAQAAAAPFVVRNRASYFKRLVAVWCGAAMLLLPWYAGGAFAQQLQSSADMGRVAGIPLASGGAQLLFQLLAGQAAPGAYRSVAIVAGIIVYSAAVTALVSAPRSRDSHPLRPDAYSALLLTVPLFLTACLALIVGNSHLLVTMRYSILALAGLALVLGRVCSHSHPILGTLLVVSLSVLSINFLLA